jgi:hypothetical protein
MRVRKWPLPLRKKRATTNLFCECRVEADDFERESAGSAIIAMNLDSAEKSQIVIRTFRRRCKMKPKKAVLLPALGLLMISGAAVQKGKSTGEVLSEVCWRTKKQIAMRLCGFNSKSLCREVALCCC